MNKSEPDISLARVLTLTEDGRRMVILARLGYSGEPSAVEWISIPASLLASTHVEEVENDANP